jgi:hypothetical protein
MAGQIDPDHLVLLGKVFQLRRPEIVTAGPAMHEYDRQSSLAFSIVSNEAPISRCHCFRRIA